MTETRLTGILNYTILTNKLGNERKKNECNKNSSFRFEFVIRDCGVLYGVSFEMINA